MRPAEENEAGPELAEESPTDLPAQRAGDRTEDEEVDSDSLSSDETVVGLTETVTSDVPDDSRPDPLWIEPDGIRAAKVLPEEEQDSSNDTTKPRGSASVLATLIVAHTSIEGRAELCVDTGADVTICTKKFIVDHLGPQALSLVDPRGKLPNLMSASYHPMKALGRIHLFVYLGTYKLDIRVIVQDEDRHSSFLLGSDAFYGKIVIDKGKFLAFGNSNHSPVPIRYRLSNEKATVVGCISIPPHTVSYVPVKVTDDPQLTGKEVCLEAADYTNLSLEDWLDGGLYTEPVSNSISEIDSDGIARVLVQNRSDDVLTFTHGLELVKVSLIQEDDYEATHESEEVCSINKVVDYSQPLDENIQKLLTQEKLSKMLPVLHVLSPEEVCNVNFIHDKQELKDLLDGTGEGFPSPPAPEPLKDYSCLEEWLGNVEHDHLVDEQWSKLKAILLRNKKAFSLSKTDTGCLRYFKADLPLKPGTGYLYSKPYPLPPKHKVEAEKKIAELLEQGIIRPSKSPHSSNIVVVNKKAINGVDQFRVCVDLRKVNEHSVPSRFPNLQIEEALVKLQGAAYRSSLDFCNAFHQIALHEDSIPITAFTIGSFQYEFLRVPFGHVTAMQIFCCAMALLCEGMEEACNYADDLMVNTPDDPALTPDQLYDLHLRHLERLLKRIIDAGMKLKADKCAWAFSADKPLVWLGYQCVKNYLYPLEAKQEAVRNFPTPQSEKQAMSFIGINSFYRKFIPGFARIAKPIHEVIVNSRKFGFSWTEKAQIAFDQLKDALCSPKLLRLPRLNETFILYSDASHGAIGVVLGQCDPRTKENYVCEYGSRMFNQAERKMSSPCKELLAIIYGLNRWRHWFLGNPVHVYTDCKAWTFLKVQTGASGKIARLALLVQEFDIHVSYIPGEKNKAADGLSRAFDDGQVALDDQITPRHPALERLNAPSLSEGEVLKLTDYLELCEPYAQRFIDEIKTDHCGSSQVDREAVHVSRVLEICQVLHVDRHHVHPTVEEEIEEELQQVEDAIERPKTEPSLSNLSSCSVFGELPTTDGSVRGVAYNIRFMTLNDSSFSLEAFIAAQDVDEFCMKLRKKLKRGSRSVERRGFYLKKGVLMRQFTTKDGQTCHTICVPRSLVDILLKSAHGNLLTGHHGSTKFLLDMSRKYYWKGMSKDVLNFQRQCSACQFNDKYPVHFKMGKVVVPLCPLHIVYYDIVPSLPRAKCGSYALLLFYDGFSRFVTGVPLASEKADYIVKKVMSHFVQPFGLPWALHSDNGRNLDGHVVRYLAALLGIRKTTTPPYTPNSNPCETMCGAVTMLIRKALNQSDQRQWPTCLPFVLHALNTTVHTATGYTPASLFFGRFEERPLVPVVPWDSECVTHSEYYTKIRRFQELAFHIARRRSNALVEKRRDRVNAKAKTHNYQIGDYVLVLNKTPALGVGQAKLRAKYVGPFRVIKVYPKSLVIIPWANRRDADGLLRPPPLFELPNRRNIEPFQARIVNVSYCKPFRGEPDQMIVTNEHLQEFLDMLGADNLSDLSSVMAPRDRPEDINSTVSRSSWRSDESSSDDDSDTSAPSDYGDSSDPDDDPLDDDQANDPPPGVEPEVVSLHSEDPDPSPHRVKSEPESEQSNPPNVDEELAALLDDLILHDHERVVLNEYLASDHNDDRRETLKDVIVEMSDPDPEVSARAEHDFRLMLDDIMLKDGATRQNDFEGESLSSRQSISEPSSGAEREPSPARTINGESSSSDSFEDEPKAGPSRLGRPRPLVLQTENFDVHVDTTARPGRPKVMRRGSDGRTLSDVPPTQATPPALHDWAADQAQRTLGRGPGTVEEEPPPATSVGRRTRSGRLSQPPHRFDPQAEQLRQLENRLRDRAIRNSLGSGSGVQITPSRPEAGHGNVTRPGMFFPSPVVDASSESSSSNPAESDKSSSAERVEPEPSGPDPTPDLNADGRSDETAISEDSLLGCLEALFDEDQPPSSDSDRGWT